MGYKVDSALGRFVIVEPMDVSTVLQAEETATVFKVLSIGKDVQEDTLTVLKKFNNEDLIIVEKGSVRKTVMGDKDVYYIMDTEIIAKVTND